MSVVICNNLRSGDDRYIYIYIYIAISIAKCSDLHRYNVLFHSVVSLHTFTCILIDTTPMTLR